MMKQIAVHVTDECILERVVPYVVSQALKPTVCGTVLDSSLVISLCIREEGG